MTDCPAARIQSVMFGSRPRLRSIAAAGAVLAVALVSACGEGDEPAATADGPTTDAGAPIPGPGDVVSSDGAAGTLVPMPNVAAAGDVITVLVDNRGDRRLDYGLANRVDRYVDGEWVEATADVYEGGPPAFAEILLTLKPGELGAPEEIPLDPDVEPGTYRVVKEVFAQSGTAPDVLELEAVFEVTG